MEVYCKPDAGVVGYSAGLLDGEGSIGIYGDKDIGRINIFQSEKNNGERLCNWLRDTWGFGKVRRCDPIPNRTGPGAVMWMWDVGPRRDILFFLECTMPYLIVKREKAERMVERIRASIDDQQRWTAWSEAEDHFLREWAGKLRVEELATRLRRSKGGIRGRLRELGLLRDGGRGWRKHEDGWTEEQDSVVRELYAVVPTSDLAAQLGRTAVAVTTRAKLLGVRKGRGWHSPFWTEERDAFLIANYGTMSSTAIGRKLGLDRHQVKNRARKLGIIKPRVRS